MSQSDSIKNIAAALLKAQTMFKKAEKNSQNPFFNSSYADFESIVDACKDGLSANGLVFIQPTTVVDGKMILKTTLMHTSGEWISSEYPVVSIKNDPQSIGSAHTYAKRYALASLLGVVAKGEDDDGNSASQGQPAATVAHQAPRPMPQPRPQAQQPKKQFTPDVTKLVSSKQLFMLDSKLAALLKPEYPDATKEALDKIASETAHNLIGLLFSCPPVKMNQVQFQDTLECVDSGEWRSVLRQAPIQEDDIPF